MPQLRQGNSLGQMSTESVSDDGQINPGRFYGDLASWWPLISPVADYAEEAEFVVSLLVDHTPTVHDVLELGSGGGHVAFHLRDRFSLTLTDVSEAMLNQSRTLNPQCRHVAGDMRTLRMGATFDAVFIHDAIDYMLTIDDLRAALTTAFVHLHPGGVAVIIPDATVETFEPSQDHGGTDGDNGSVRFLEWTHPPSPIDGVVETDYVFALRDHGEHAGTKRGLRIVQETHRTGLFTRATWIDLFAEVGFRVERIVEETNENRVGRDVFVAARPGNVALLPDVSFAERVERLDELIGKRVRLRLATTVDALRVVEIRSTPEVRRRWMGDDLFAEFLDDIASDELTLLMIEDEHGRVIGAIQWDSENDSMYAHARMDLYVDPAVHGQGYGTDAVRTLATHLIDRLGHHRIVIDPAADNVAAIRCYGAVGFRPVGVMRRYELGPDGTWHDGLLMDLLPEDLVRPPPT